MSTLAPSSGCIFSLRADVGARLQRAEMGGREREASRAVGNHEEPGRRRFARESAREHRRRHRRLAQRPGDGDDGHGTGEWRRGRRRRRRRRWWWWWSGATGERSHGAISARRGVGGKGRLFTSTHANLLNQTYKKKKNYKNYAFVFLPVSSALTCTQVCKVSRQAKPSKIE